MRNYIILALSILTLTCQAQIADTWHGTLQVTPTYSLPLVLHITEGADGYSATLDSPEQGAQGIPVDQISFSPDSRTLSWQSRTIGAGYSGQLDGDTIRGDFSQQGFTTRLDLIRGEYRKKEPKDDLPYLSTELTIPSGEVTLAATLTKPSEQKSSTAVVLVAGSGPNDRDEKLGPHKPLRDIADHLTRQGITVLRYDKRGVGESTGTFGASMLSDFVADAKSALEYLQGTGRYSRVGLIGHSEGGLIAERIAAESPAEVDFIVLLAAPGTSGVEIITYQNVVMMASLISPETKEDFAKVTGETFRDLAYHSTTRAEDSTLMRGYFERVLPLVREEQRADTRAMVLSDRYFSSMLDATSTPYYKEFLRSDPSVLLPQITCPILALNGSKDMQVEASGNLSAIKRLATASSGVTTEVIAGLNHLFLPCSSGLPGEYVHLKPGFSSEALEMMTEWIKEGELGR